MQRGKFTFNIDRGGTFTDFYVQEHDESGKTIKEHVFKEPSVRQGKEGPVEGIRKFLDKHIGNSANTKIPAAHIERINLGTTLATNALLEKKGHRNAVLFTQGFEDLLKIKNQTRPDIFDLQCALPEPLHTETFGVDQRVYLHEHPSSEKVQTDKYSLYVKHPDVEQLKKIAEQIREKGITSVAIAFANSYLYPDNELFVKDFLLKEGFEQVYLSCQNRSIGYLGRAETCGLEAFLSPFLDEYFVRFGKEFDSPPSLRVMKSDGGFANDRIRASNALLSGPAGGLIGYSKLIPTIERFPSAGKVTTIIGLDMGGTSTDVSKFSGEEFEHTYNFSINGIEINTPHLQIDTIAAGGGSQLTFVNGLFQVGPESVGSDPGPVCYGIGDQLAITDANIVLNRLDLDNFPKVFGRNRKEPVNPVLSRAAFDRLAEAINKQVQNKKSVEDIALGFVEMSNEMMARSVRKLYSTGKPEVLIVFGSAGGQHACGIAEKIGVDKVFIHKYSGVLSAYGLSKSDIVEQRKLYLGTKVEHQQKDNSFEALN